MFPYAGFYVMLPFLFDPGMVEGECSDKFFFSICSQNGEALDRWQNPSLHLYTHFNIKERRHRFSLFTSTCYTNYLISLITHLVQCIMEYKIQISKEDCTTNLAKSVHYSLLLACFQRMAATTGHAFFRHSQYVSEKKSFEGKSKGLCALVHHSI